MLHHNCEADYNEEVMVGEADGGSIGERHENALVRSN